MARSKTTGRIFKSKAISMEPTLRKAAEKRAASLKMTFSEYARRCIADDVRRGGGIIIAPEKE